jgi:hypothetical protein
MSLINKQSMTDKNRAAHQRNGQKSRGPATPAGKERSRAANLRHGIYSQQRDEAITALGEDPAQLDALLDATRRHWRPANDYEAHLSDRLARLLWRMDRAERIQESLAAHLVLEHEKRRRAVARQLRDKFDPHFRLLEGLVESAADPRFYTTSSHLRGFCEAAGNPPQNDLEADFLLLLHRLRRPPDPTPGPAEGEIPSLDGNGQTPLPDREECGKGGVVVPNLESTAPGSAPLEAGSRPSAAAPVDDPFLRRQAQLDEDDFPVPWPDEEVAEGPERDALREVLVIRAKSLLVMEHLARDPAMNEYEAPLSRWQRDPLLATPSDEEKQERGEEDRCFRQFARLGSLLLKFQTAATQRAEQDDEIAAPNDPQPGAPADEAWPSGQPSEDAQDARATQPGAAEPAENEGASGYVDENTQAEQTAPDGMTESEVRGPESGVKSAAAETRCSKLETAPIDNRQSKIDNEVSGAGGNASSVSNFSNAPGKMADASGKVTRLETCAPAVGGLSGENPGTDLNMSPKL